MTDSQQLLAEYARNGSDAAFRELVTRYVDLVYSTALRLVEGDTHRAEDVAQTVFVDLARLARTLSHVVMPVGWLHRHTCFVAANTLRGERRRQSRERQAVEMNALQTNSGADFSQVAPLLDEAINELGEADRTAILLRFFEQHDFRSVGQALGSNEDAARMRVTRALEKLETLLKRRGVTASSGALAVVLGANAVQAAPVGLAVTISTAAGAGITTTATIATQTTMHWLNLKSVSAIVAAAVAAGTGTHLVQQREATRLRTQNQNLISEREKLTNERDTSLLAVAANKNELERLLKNQGELLRLRGEVGQWRRQLDSQKAQTSSRPASQTETTRKVGHPPGSYISKDQIAYAGYTTPEAALETVTWAMWSGTYEQVNEGVSPELLAEELKDPKNREGFETRQKIMAPLFKGMQIVARKSLAEDRVELKVKMDADPLPNQEREMRPFMIQPMVKVGDEWKLGGSTQDHQATWDNDGQIQTFAP